MQIHTMGILLALAFLMSCKPDSPEPPDGSSDLRKDSLILENSGSHEWKPDFNAKATIILIGGGGGGGGGIKHSGSNTELTTGGGGGAGAGEVKEFQNIAINGGVTYLIFVGKAGQGGGLGTNGIAGGSSTITDNDGFFKSAGGGGFGRTGPEDSFIGGVAGAGFPSGSDGGTGLNSGADPNEAFAPGGAGGNNGSGFGKGGDGGQGSSNSGGSVVQGGAGQAGQVGFVKIVYEEIE